MLIRQAYPELLRRTKCVAQELLFLHVVDCYQIPPQALGLCLGLLPGCRSGQQILAAIPLEEFVFHDSLECSNAIDVIPFASATPVHPVHDGIVFIPAPVVWLSLCPIGEAGGFAADPFELPFCLLIRQANPELLRRTKCAEQEILFLHGVDCDQIPPQALGLCLGLLPGSRLEQAIERAIVLAIALGSGYGRSGAIYGHAVCATDFDRCLVIDKQVAPLGTSAVGPAASSDPVALEHAVERRQAGPAVDENRATQAGAAAADATRAAGAVGASASCTPETATGPSSSSTAILASGAIVAINSSTATGTATSAKPTGAPIAPIAAVVGRVSEEAAAVTATATAARAPASTESAGGTAPPISPRISRTTTSSAASASGSPVEGTAPASRGAVAVVTTTVPHALTAVSATGPIRREGDVIENDIARVDEQGTARAQAATAAVPTVGTTGPPIGEGEPRQCDIGTVDVENLSGRLTTDRGVAIIFEHDVVTCADEERAVQIDRTTDTRKIDRIHAGIVIRELNCRTQRADATIVVVCHPQGIGVKKLTILLDLNQLAVDHDLPVVILSP